LDLPLPCDANVDQCHAGDSLIAECWAGPNRRGLLENIQAIEPPTRAPAETVGSGLGQIRLPQLFGSLLFLSVDSKRGNRRTNRERKQENGGCSGQHGNDRIAAAPAPALLNSIRWPGKNRFVLNESLEFLCQFSRRCVT